MHPKIIIIFLLIFPLFFTACGPSKEELSIKRLESINKNLVRENTMLKSQLTNLKKSLQSEQESKSKSQQSIQGLVKKNTHLRESNIKLEAKVEELSKDNKELKDAKKYTFNKEYEEEIEKRIRTKVSKEYMTYVGLFVLLSVLVFIVVYWNLIKKKNEARLSYKQKEIDKLQREKKDAESDFSNKCKEMASDHLREKEEMKMEQQKSDRNKIVDKIEKMQKHRERLQSQLPAAE